MSGRLDVTASLNVSGPIADGMAERALDDFRRDARQAIADRGVELLKAFPMDKTGRARGGFQANLRTVTRGAAVAIPGPNIKGVVWSPWLEGTSRRNRSTKFGGYHLFRKTADQLGDEAGAIAERELQKYLPKMGGE